MDTNTNDFMLISGYAIIRKSSVKEVVPVFSEGYEITVIAPSTRDEDFTFILDKTTEVSLVIHRTDDNAADLSPANFVRIVKDSEVLTFAQLTETFFKSKDKQVENMQTKIDNYKKRVRKTAKYQEKVAAIQASPTDPNYVSNLSAIADDAPTPESLLEQKNRVAYITETLQKKIDSVYEEENPEEDEETDEGEETAKNAIFAMFDNEDSSEHIANTVTALLNEFYSVNILGIDIVNINDNDSEGNDFFGADDFSHEADNDTLDEGSIDYAELHDNALSNAERILNSPDTLTNIKPDDVDEDTATVVEDDPDYEPADLDDEDEEKTED